MSSLAKDFELTPMEIGNPHSKEFLTTRLGRIVDAASYPLILVLVFVTLEYSTLYFYFSSEKNGIILRTNDNAPELINAIYFSVLTFTSLGYGEFTPQGYGKLIAVAVLLSGLILVALLIGKIASERQFSISLLLYTSDCQRRLKGFCEDLKRITKELAENIAKPNPVLLGNGIEEMQNLIETINKYVTFHAHQARLAHFGNDSALKALYVEMLAAQKVCALAFQSPCADERGSSRCIRCVVKITKITALLTMFQGESEGKRASRIERPSPDLVAMKNTVADLRIWAFTHPSPWLLSKIIPLTPAESVATWSKDLHERIASELGISKKLARRCVDNLIAQKKVPRKMILSKQQIAEDSLKIDLSKMLNTLNTKTLVLERQKSSGGPILERLEQLNALFHQIRKKIEINAERGIFFNRLQIERKFLQLHRTQLSILEICKSAKFHDYEKEKAIALAYSVSRLADAVFEISFGLKPMSIKYRVLRIFNESNKFFDINCDAHLIKMKRQPPAMNLEELFARSSPGRTRKHEYTCDDLKPNNG